MGEGPERFVIKVPKTIADIQNLLKELGTGESSCHG